MSAILADAHGTETVRLVVLPPVVSAKIADFLAAGMTGHIQLNVKCGEVRSCHVTEVVDASAAAGPDGNDRRP